MRSINIHRNRPLPCHSPARLTTQRASEGTYLRLTESRSASQELPVWSTFLWRVVTWGACLLLSMMLGLSPQELNAQELNAQDWPPKIQRVLPPAGIELPAERISQIKQGLAEIQSTLKSVVQQGKLTGNTDGDIAALVKSVEYALIHNEFYDPKDVDKATSVLNEAKRRLENIKSNQQPWRRATGLVVRGYRSELDHSAQPYGLVIPANHDFSKPSSLYVWLHGRGDKQTDMHFINERMSRPGQISPANAIVLHPFGRHCVAFKFAGELDVFEALKHVMSEYLVDPKRIVLMGFSMGGAGAWHLGAHYTDHWVAVSPGAGFAETARYRRLKPEEFPAAHEQTLWGLYDTPAYTRNLFNVPLIAYSGELDKQIQAARIMEEAFQAEGRTLPHLIGPGVEHKYEPDTLKELLRQIDVIVAQGRDDMPKEVHLQTRTLRYARQNWLQVESLQRHWTEARVDAKIESEKRISLTTKNVQSIRLFPWSDMIGTTIQIDGQQVVIGRGVASSGRSGSSPTRAALVAKVGDQWQEAQPTSELRKKAGLQGPIDDAFVGPVPFVVVRPKPTKIPELDRWCQFEFQHFVDRWRALMRGDATVIDEESAESYFGKANIVVWGNASSSETIAKLNGKIPVQWQGDSWEFGGQRYQSKKFVPALIYPNPFDPERYVVVNSGITFREGHDSTNSNQTPKLPDWAVVDLSEPPSAIAPGQIAAAGFFDESWGLAR